MIKIAMMNTYRSSNNSTDSICVDMKQEVSQDLKSPLQSDTI